MKGDLAIFESCRPRVLGIAYRMLGDMSAAEDVAQEAWLRWRNVEADEIRDPGAWLSTTTVRLSLDALRAVRSRRESYVGPWLPEPISPDDARAFGADAPSEHAELASDLSMALMHVLERLSPEERAALILHDAFDFDYCEIAATLGKTEPACRKLVSRARERVKTDRPRFTASRDSHRDLLARFARASMAADAEALASLFAPDAIAYTDGGGRKLAALPIRGADKIARFVVGLARKLSFDPAPKSMATEINGRAGLVTSIGDDSLTAITLETDGERITAIYLQRNPDKLGRLSRSLGWPAALGQGPRS